MDRNAAAVRELWRVNPAVREPRGAPQGVQLRRENRGALSVRLHMAPRRLLKLITCAKRM